MRPLSEKDRERLEEIRRMRTIGVLMGGPSSEREISIKSGEAVFVPLKQAGYPVEKILFQTEEELKTLLLARRIDLAFITLHGAFGEDGTVQEILEEQQIPYIGSGVEASRLAFDKWRMHQRLLQHGLPVPASRLLGPLDPIPWEELLFPLVVKPVCQGSSLGLSIVDQPEALPHAVQEAFRYDGRLLLEEYIKGRELTVGILEGEALPVIEIIPGNRFYDFDAKYKSDKTRFQVPAPLEEPLARSIQGLALKTHQLAGCEGFSRVDLLLKEDNAPVLLEINTIPGLTSRSLLPRACQGVGIDFLSLCERLLLQALRRVPSRHAKTEVQNP